MSGQPRSKVVFVGNLPFDCSEEQLVDVFNSVGPVVSFRLVFDHGTGKPKGFGFCEYKDSETAASALRNLQGVEVGGRGLRLDFADPDDPGRRAPRGGGGGGGGGGFSGPRGNDRDNGGGGGGDRGEIKALPAGIVLNGGSSAVDSISQTLATMPPGQLLDIMSQMKALVTTSPFEARTLLTANPQLSYALFQAMLMMNLVDPAVLQKMLPPTNAPPPSNYTGNAPPYSNPNSYNRAPAPPPPSTNSYGQPPPSHQPPQQGYGNYQGQSQQPPSTYGAPPPPPPQASAPPGAPQVAPEQAALIAQVLAMKQEDIDNLPEESRNTIMLIRAQAAAQMGGGRR